MNRFIRSIVTLALASLVVPCATAGEPTPQNNRKVVIVKDGKVFTGDSIDMADVAGGSVSRGFLGVTTMQLTPELREHFRVSKDAGVLVSKIVAEGPAAKAGLKPGDIITAIEGTAVDSASDVSRIIRDRKKGDVVRIEYVRDGVPANATASLDVRERQIVDLRDLNIEIPEVGMHLQQYFNSPEWKAKMEHLQTLPDCSAVQQRMKDLETKMKDLERRLNGK